MQIFYRNSHFPDRHHKHLVTGNLKIMKRSILRKGVIKLPKCIEVTAIDLGVEAKCNVLESLHNSACIWYSKIDTETSFPSVNI